MTRILLASTSPRRRELLAACGVQFDVLAPDCDETPQAGESPADLVRRLSALKARTIAEAHQDAWVIGGDTIVVLGNEILGKPRDEADAVAMLQKMAGQRHVVFGGLTVMCKAHGIVETVLDTTSVLMVPMSEAIIRWYVGTKEPLDKAGSYALQGIGGQFVDRIEGSYSNVIGLNITALMAMLRRFQLVAA